MKSIRRIIALFALLTLALRGILSFLSWFEQQDEVGSVWVDDEEFEEAF